MRRSVTYGSVCVALVLVAVIVFSFAHAATTNFNFPVLRTCTRVGSQITVNLQANGVTSVNAWQLNITFDSLTLGLKSVTPGTTWNSGGQYYANHANSSGTYLYAFAYQNNNTLTKSSSFIVLSYVFTVLSRPGISEFHIVNSTEDSLSGTYLLGQSQAIQAYTTTDGEFDNCINAPSP